MISFDDIMMIDGVIVATIFAVAVLGWYKGFSGELAHIITLTGLTAGLFFVYPHVYNFFYDLFDAASPTLLMWGLIVLLLVVAFFCFGFISRGMTHVLKAHFGEKTDKFLGFFFGIVRGFLLALIGLILAGMLGPPRMHDMLTTRSHAGRFVCYELVPVVQPHLDRINISDKIRSLRSGLRPDEPDYK